VCRAIASQATRQARKESKSERHLLNRDQLLLFQGELRAGQEAEPLKIVELSKKIIHSREKNGTQRHKAVILRA
jgi:hypothetical protein